MFNKNDSNSSSSSLIAQLMMLSLTSLYIIAYIPLMLLTNQIALFEVVYFTYTFQLTCEGIYFGFQDEINPVLSSFSSYNLYLYHSLVLIYLIQAVP